jgi:predicted AAA+ superfamily ATPase
MEKPTFNAWIFIHWMHKIPYNFVMYLKRIIEQRIQNSLNRIGCVMVVGPKGIGKTETSKKLCKSFIELDNPSKNYKQLLEVDYEFILNGEKPRLIDEWQEVPKVFNLIRREIDNQNLKGAYILCGSTSAEIDKELHSGMNRVSRIKMRPLSYTELKLSEQKIDFNSFFDKDFILSPIETNFPLKKHIESICIGGFPLNIENNLSDS